MSTEVPRRYSGGEPSRLSRRKTRNQKTTADPNLLCSCVLDETRPALLAPNHGRKAWRGTESARYAGYLGHAVLELIKVVPKSDVVLPCMLRCPLLSEDFRVKNSGSVAGQNADGRWLNLLRMQAPNHLQTLPQMSPD